MRSKLTRRLLPALQASEKAVKAVHYARGARAVIGEVVGRIVGGVTPQG